MVLPRLSYKPSVRDNEEAGLGDGTELLAVLLELGRADLDAVGQKRHLALAAAKDDALARVDEHLGGVSPKGLLHRVAELTIGRLRIRLGGHAQRRPADRLAFVPTRAQAAQAG